MKSEYLAVKPVHTEVATEVWCTKAWIVLKPLYAGRLLLNKVEDGKVHLPAAYMQREISKYSRWYT